MATSVDKWASQQADRYRRRRWFMRDVLLRYIGFPLLVKPHVVGLENIPPAGATILMMNHTIAIDGVLILGVIRQRDVVPIIKHESLEDPLLGIFTRNWGAFGIRRGEVDRDGLKTILDLLSLGHIVLMSPEGTRQAALMRPKDGLTYVALKSDPVIVPVAVWNGETWYQDLFRPRRTHAQIAFGKPFRLKEAGQRVSREAMGKITDEMMYQLAYLLPESYRGEYADFSHQTCDHLVFEQG